MLQYCYIYLRRQWILVLAVSWLVFAATASPNFTTVNVNEGDNQTATCHATANPDVEVYWTYGDNPDGFQNGTVLEFIDISRNESGNYTCHVANTTHPEENNIVTVVDVNVFYPAEITLFSVTPTTPVSENDTLGITCHVNGNPSPTWEIRHNVTREVFYRSSESGGASVNVTAACKHNGAFVCTGNNSLNGEVNASRQQDAQVFCAPEMAVVKIHVKDVKLGSTVRLKEFVYGYPKPTFTWSRDADTWLRGNMTVYRDTYPNYGLLTLPNIQMSDFGLYWLLVNNSLGNFTTPFLLAPDQYPPAPTNLTFSELTNTSVRLSWTSGFDKPGNMSFVVMRHLEYTDEWLQMKRIYPQHSDTHYNHGVGPQRWHYDLTDLDEGMYILTVEAKVQRFWDGSGYSNVITFNITGPATTPPTPSPTPWPSVNHDVSHHQSPWLIVAYCGIAVAVAACLLASAIVLVTRRMRYNARRRHQAWQLFDTCHN